MSDVPQVTAGILFGPWNPGIEPQLPRRFLCLATLFRPENIFSSLKASIRD